MISSPIRSHGKIKNKYPTNKKIPLDANINPLFTFINLFNLLKQKNAMAPSAAVTTAPNIAEITFTDKSVMRDYFSWV